MVYPKLSLTALRLMIATAAGVTLHDMTACGPSGDDRTENPIPGVPTSSSGCGPRIETRCFPLQSLDQGATSTTGTGGVGTSTSGTGTAGVDTESTDTDTGTGTTGGVGNDFPAECAGYEDNLPDQVSPDAWCTPVEPVIPEVEDGLCCFSVSCQMFCGEGRPFIVGGAPRVAAAVRRSDWGTSVAPRVGHLDAGARQALAEAWAKDGLMEHASVAAFSRFALQLLALGAPVRLLEATQAAIRDEIEHAKICFAIASVYAGSPIGPDALRTDDALVGSTDVEQILIDVVQEGCVGETLAALIAATAAEHATDPTVCEALQRIAADEARHAALAWESLAWMLERGDAELREIAKQAFATAPMPVACDDAGFPDVWRACGRLDAHTLARTVKAGLDEVVRPTARALLTSPAERADVTAT